MAAAQRSGFVDDAILNCRLQQLKYLFKESDTLHGIRTREGFSPLVLALKIEDERKRRKVFDFFFSRGADISVKDPKYKRDVLMWACYLERVDQATKLLDGAPGEFDLGQPDVAGMLALHYAVRSGNPLCVFRIVREMKKYRLPVDVPNAEGLTPFLDAKRLGFELIAQILVKEGNACPTQFDTKRFRTKTRWSEAGLKQREEEQYIKALEEVRIVGSLRPHTSYQKRRELSCKWRTPGATSELTDGALSTRRPKTSPVHTGTSHSMEMYRDLQIKDLQNIVDGKTSVCDIRKKREFEKKNTDVSDQTFSVSRQTVRQNGRVHVWPKLSLLMSLSEKAASLSTDAFANSVPGEFGRGKPAEDHKTTAHSNRTTAQSSHSVMLTSMLTSLSQQMSSAFKKPAVARPMPPIQPNQPSRRRKKNSTFAFIMKTTPNKRRTSRRGKQLPQSTITLKSEKNQLGNKHYKTHAETRQPSTYRKVGIDASSSSAKMNIGSKQSHLPAVRT